MTLYLLCQCHPGTLQSQRQSAAEVGLPFDENFPAFWRKIHSTAKWQIFLSCYKNLSTVLPNDENPRTEKKSLHPAKWRKRVISPKKTTQKTIKKPLLLLGTCRMQNCPPYLWPPKVAKVLFLGAWVKLCNKIYPLKLTIVFWRKTQAVLFNTKVNVNELVTRQTYLLFLNA